MQKAWSISGTTLRDDPGSDDEITIVNNTGSHHGLQHDEQAVRLNGGSGLDDADADLDDADIDDDLDDDLMDKISSSPSIDDGGCSLHSLHSLPCTRPTRRESMTPSLSPTSPSPASSSPFTNTPLHFPISSSPPNYSPWSAEHHSGEYARTAKEPDSIAQASPEVSSGSGYENLSIPGQHRHLAQDTPQLPQILLNNSVDDPFVGVATSPPRTTNGTPPPMNEDSDSDDSWTTDSDADSWDQSQDQNDASNDVSFSDDPRFIDSGWGGECLRETEDIDFEFVYALHTFVATVEGQANATKGDTMVLLDDSNSYWWLVRIVKDSSIGRDQQSSTCHFAYLAQATSPQNTLKRPPNDWLVSTNTGISTSPQPCSATRPRRQRIRSRRRCGEETQRLCNLACQPMLKPRITTTRQTRAMVSCLEARNQRSYSSNSSKRPRTSQDKRTVRPRSRCRPTAREPTATVRLKGPSAQVTMRRGTTKRRGEVRRPWTVQWTPKSRATAHYATRTLSSRTENTETRKITLTPNLLRDDSSPTSAVAPRERGPSLESLEKNGFADKVKDKKDKKEKKGMLSGLFKRKDRKAKGLLDSQDSDLEKPDDLDRSQAPSKPSEDSLERPSVEQTQTAPLRQPSKGKLQKVHRTRDDSPQKTKGILKTESSIDSPALSVASSEASTSKPAEQQAATMRVVSPEQDGQRGLPVEDRAQPAETRPQESQAQETRPQENRIQEPQPQDNRPQEIRPQENRPAAKAMGSNNPFNKMINIQQNDEPKPETKLETKPEPTVEQVKPARERVPMDDFDSDGSSDPFADPGAQNKSAQPDASVPAGRLSESPVHVSMADAQPPTKAAVQERDREPDPRQPPGLTADSSSQETSSPVSTPTPDDSPMKTIPEHPAGSAMRTGHTPSPTSHAPNAKAIPAPTRPAPVPTKNEADRGMSPPISSDSAILPAWSDSSLRAYLDDGSDVRDMLLVVNDTTGVVPVGKDHPLMENLFAEETRTVQGLSGELDRLLTGLLNKRIRRAGSGASKISSSSGSGRSAHGRLAAR